MTEIIYEEALRYIAHCLTHAQRRALVHALVSDPDNDRPRVHANLKTVMALRASVKQPEGLIMQAGMYQYLTPLGVAVARHINRSGEYEIPRDPESSFLRSA